MTVVQRCGTLETMDDTVVFMLGVEIGREIESAKQEVDQGVSLVEVMDTYGENMERIFRGLDAEQTEALHRYVAAKWLSAALHEPREATKVFGQMLSMGK